MPSFLSIDLESAKHDDAAAAADDDDKNNGEFVVAMMRQAFPQGEITPH